MPTAPVQKAGAAKGQAAGLVMIRFCAGIFMLFFGFEKASWLLDSTPLATLLSFWFTDAPPVSRWFLERMMPGAPVFARLLPVGAMLGGGALILGFWTRMAAALSLLVLLSLQLAAGAMFRYAYLSDGSGLPLLGALLALIVGGGKLPWSVRK